MNNFQRGIYQTLADKVPIYDLADEDPEEGRSRAPLLVVISLVMLAAFAGGIWLAYTGAERGRQGASLVIAAPEGPVRDAPAEAAPAPGLTVSPKQGAQTSALAPQTGTKAEPPPIRLSQTALPEPPAQAARAAQPAAPAQTPKVARPPQQPAAGTSKALFGAAVLQLGAFDSQELANGAWEAFRARYAMAANWAPDVQRADLGAKGIMYRLRVGPFTDRAAATNACVQLKAAGANCFVAAP